MTTIRISLEKVTLEDIRNFGMIPEFIGRLPIVFTLRGLTKEMLVKILKEPKNAILKQYQKLLALDEVQLDFEDGCTGGDRRESSGEKNRSAGHCERSSKISCWISCMRSRKMTASAKLRSQEIILNIKADL